MVIKFLVYTIKLSLIVEETGLTVFVKYRLIT